VADKVDDGYPPEGWYPDPEDSNYLRRWNGAAWTAERVPASRGRRRLRAHDGAGTVSSASTVEAGGIMPAFAGERPDSAGDHSDAPAPAPEPTDHGLDAEFVRRQAEIDRLVEREQGLAQAVEDRRAEIDHIAEREEELLQRIGDARAELARIEEQVAAAEAEERRLTELAASEAAATEQLERRRAELAELDRDMVEAQRAAEGELEGLRSAVEDVRKDHAAATAQAEEAARQLDELAGRREEATREHEELTREHQALRSEHAELTRRHAGMVAEYEELTRLHQDLSRRHEELAGELETRRAELAEAEGAVTAARTELVDLGERVAAQDLGLYDYRHPAEDSVVLATRLAALRESIVETLRTGEAITAPKNFKIGHSSSKGQQVLAEVTALSLRAYNSEAENAVRTAGPGGIDGALTRLIRAREAVARHGEWIGVAITDRYHALRAQEIEMAGEHKIRKEREEAVAAAAHASGTPLPPEYVSGDGREYVPGAGGYGTGTPGYGTGAPGYGGVPGYGSGTPGYSAGPGYTPGASGYAPDGGQVPGPTAQPEPTSYAGQPAHGGSTPLGGEVPDPASGPPGWEPPAPVTSNGRFSH